MIKFPKLLCSAMIAVFKMMFVEKRLDQLSFKPHHPHTECQDEMLTQAISLCQVFLVKWCFY